MIKLRSIAGGLVCAMAGWCAQASALEVRYRAVDVADAVVGVDRWRYDYTLIGSLGEFEGVNLLFDPTTRGSLQMVTLPDPTALDVFLEQPSTALPADGLLAITAVRPVVDEQLNFSVAFDVLGGGNPGAQPYEVFDASFTLVSTANTVAAPVPEPATAALFLAALAVLIPMTRRRPAANG